MMLALTLWEPWATLIAEGHKQYETRSWGTSYRGVMMIHASKRWDGASRSMCDELARQFPEVLSGYWGRTFPLGCIVAAVELVTIHKVEDIRDSLSPLELAVGNYQDGRYAWEVKVVKLPPEPIPARGRQGLWTWDYETGEQ